MQNCRWRFALRKSAGTPTCVSALRRSPERVWRRRIQHVHPRPGVTASRSRMAAHHSRQRSRGKRALQRAGRSNRRRNSKRPNQVPAARRGHRSKNLLFATTRFRTRCERPLRRTPSERGPFPYYQPDGWTASPRGGEARGRENDRYVSHGGHLLTTAGLARKRQVSLRRPPGRHTLHTMPVCKSRNACMAGKPRGSSRGQQHERS